MNLNPYLKPEEEEILHHVRIGIAGLGGLGSNCMHHLVRAGLIHFSIADFDTVSESNLNRQFYFPDQIGRRKTDACVENMKRLNPELDLRIFSGKITPENFREVFGDCRILVEAFDRAEEKEMLIREALSAGKTVVAASGIAGWGRSTSLTVRKIGKQLYLAGDFQSGVTEFMPPHSPRVGIAAAQEANTVLAILLNQEI